MTYPNEDALSLDVKVGNGELVGERHFEERGRDILVRVRQECTGYGKTNCSGLELRDFRKKRDRELTGRRAGEKKDAAVSR